MESQKTLSASSIKALENCSWLYWCQYVKKIPQRTNEGAQRGSLAHLVFELLLNPRHRKHFDYIINSQSIKGSKAIRRLVIKHLKKEKILSTSNYELMDDMLVVGLKNDFYGEREGLSGEISKPEFRFELENQEPFYRVRGYIDKYITYPNGKVKIIDYKSSKSKFSSEELDTNVQAFVYSLVGYKLLKATNVSAEFIFLRFARQPIQEVRPTKKELEGFEHYLAYLYELIVNFTEESAKNNLAAYNQKNKWLCKAGATWVCPYLKAFKYYALINEDGSVARTAMVKEDLKMETGQTLKYMSYSGCIAWNNKQIPTEL